MRQHIADHTCAPIPPWAWRGIPLAVGVLAAVWTLLNTPFALLPGRDAAALTGYAGLHPFRSVGMPIWGALVWALSRAPFPLAHSLAGVQSLLAGLTAASIAWLLLHVPFSAKRSVADGAREAGSRMAAALFGSLYFIAAPSFLRTFAFPRPEAVSVALLLGGVALAARYLARGNAIAWAASVALISLSAAEHVAAAIVAPVVLAAALARNLLLGHSARRAVGVSATAALWGAAAIAAGVALFMRSPAAEWREVDTLIEAARLFWREYMDRGPRALPRVGWLVVALFAYIPLVFVLAPSSGASRIRRKTAAFYLLALPILALIALFNLPGAPLRVAHTPSPLPLVYAAIAI